MSEPIHALIAVNEEREFLHLRDLFAGARAAVYEVRWAQPPDGVVSALEDRRYQVCLIANNFGSEPLELARRVRATQPALPVLLILKRADAGIVDSATKAGIVDVVVKDGLTSRSLHRTVCYALALERKQAELGRLAAYPQHNPNPIVELAPDGSIVYSNPAAENLFKKLGEPSVSGLLPSNLEEIVREALKTNSTHQQQVSRGLQTFQWCFVPVRDLGVVHGYGIEISERLNLESQLRHSVKMEAVGQLAAGVAHDFNNILTVIQGHANLLLDALEDSSIHGKPLKHICLSAEKASNLIRQLLLFSRKQVMQPRHVDLNDKLQNVTRMLQRMMGEDIALEVIECPGLSSVHADSGMVEQVLMNLAVNAREAMPRGGKFTVGLSAETFPEKRDSLNPEAQLGDFVCLMVSDTGCGIDPAIVHQIFEPFFTTKEAGNGTGLGLAAVHGIVKQHQGWIDVETTVGAGTTFRIYFPASARRPEPAGDTQANEKVSGGKETILVVEDESALRELVEEILSLYGYRVVTASSGVDALRVWEKNRDQVDLLLTDLVMPEGISGRELAERLQKQAPALKVVYTSGYSPGMAGKDLALLDGFNFLPKPYPPTRLAEVVRECLDGRFDALAVN